MNERIIKLDGIRAVACILIVILHCPDQFFPSYLSFFRKFNLTMYVDLFYCLSGFVIAYNYSKFENSKLLLKFLLKRLFRLYPLLLFTSFSILFFSFLLNLNQDILWFFSSISLINSTPVPYLINKVFELDYQVLNNGIYNPSWSISTEIVTYSIYSIVSFFLPKKRDWIFLSIIIFSFLFCFLNGGYWGYTIGLGVFRGLVSFFIGYFVFKYHNLIKGLFKIHLSENLLLLSFVLIMIFVNFYLTDSKELVSMFLIPIYFGVFILYLLNSKGMITKFLEHKAVNFIGKISFSIYLNHLLLLTIFKELKIFEVLGKDLTFFTSILFLISYSFITFLIFEKKLFKYLKIKFI